MSDPAPHLSYLQRLPQDTLIIIVSFLDRDSSRVFKYTCKEGALARAPFEKRWLKEIGSCPCGQPSEAITDLRESSACVRCLKSVSIVGPSGLFVHTSAEDSPSSGGPDTCSKFRCFIPKSSDDNLWPRRIGSDECCECRKGCEVAPGVWRCSNSEDDAIEAECDGGLRVHCLYERENGSLGFSLPVSKEECLRVRQCRVCKIPMCSSSECGYVVLKRGWTYCSSECASVHDFLCQSCGMDWRLIDEGACSDQSKFSTKRMTTRSTTKRLKIMEAAFYDCSGRSFLCDKNIMCKACTWEFSGSHYCEPCVESATFIEGCRGCGSEDPPRRLFTPPDDSSRSASPAPSPWVTRIS